MDMKVRLLCCGCDGMVVGMMIRGSAVSVKAFQESSLQALSDSRIFGLERNSGQPEGEIVLAREEEPKGVVVFKQDTQTIALNKLGRWDMIPRLFGLSNPRQFLKGEVTIRVGIARVLPRQLKFMKSKQIKHFESR